MILKNSSEKSKKAIAEKFFSLLYQRP